MSSTSHLHGIAIRKSEEIFSTHHSCDGSQSKNTSHVAVLYMNNTITVGSYCTDGLQFLNYHLSAALTGTVLFSTTIFSPSATTAICLAADSMYFKSGARPYSTND